MNSSAEFPTCRRNSCQQAEPLAGRGRRRHRPGQGAGARPRAAVALVLTLGLPWLAGCGDTNGGDPVAGVATAPPAQTTGAAAGRQAASNQTSAAAQISSDELVQALGGEVFTLSAPAGADPDAIAGLALRYGGENGRIDPIGGATGYSGGEPLRVVLFRQSGGVMRFAILGNDGLRDGMEATLPDFPAATANPQRQGLTDAAWLVRFGLVGEPDSSAAEAGEDEADLIFHLQREGRDGA